MAETKPTPEEEPEELVRQFGPMDTGKIVVAAATSGEDMTTFFEREWEPEVPFPD